MQKKIMPTSFIFLALLFLLPVISTDIYLPCLQSISVFFKTSVQEVQSTIIFYFFIFGLAQLIYGPLSDHFGRKPVLITGLFIYLLTTLLCTVASTIEVLILLRSIQALSLGCSGLVFAILQDLYDSRKVAQLIAYMSACIAVSRIISPIIGGYIGALASWQSTFIFLGGIGVFLLVISIFSFDETTKCKKMTTCNFLKNYKMLFSNRTYLRHTCSSALAFGALYSYVSGAPVILLNTLNYPPEHFGLIFPLSAIGYLLGAFLSGKMLLFFGMDRLFKIGMTTLILGSIAMVLSCSLFDVHILNLLIPQFFCEFGVSIILPIATARALQATPQQAGAGSSFIGFLRFIFAAYGSYLTSLFQGSFFLSLIVFSFSFCCLLINIFLREKDTPCNEEIA